MCRSIDLKLEPDAAPARRFVIDITRPDGQRDCRVAIGGTSFDHAIAALEHAAAGARISVRPLPLHLRGEPA
jgi:hypothetical protein